MDRRYVLGGLAALAAGPAAAAEDTPLAHGVLENNELAKKFITAPSSLPRLLVWGPDGKQPIADLVKDRTVIMPLWAEWCTPCMIELPEFAKLQKKYGSKSFAIVPILTSTERQFNPTALRKILNGLVNNDAFEPLIEDQLGARLASNMAVRGHVGGARVAGQSVALPCNLVIAPGGEVKARIFGTVAAKDNSAEKAKSYDEALNHAQDGAYETLWGRPEGDQFVAALADGFLTRS